MRVEKTSPFYHDWQRLALDIRGLGLTHDQIAYELEWRYGVIVDPSMVGYFTKGGKGPKAPIANYPMGAALLQLKEDLNEHAKVFAG